MRLLLWVQVGNMVLHGWLAALGLLEAAAQGRWGELPTLPPPFEEPAPEEEDDETAMETAAASADAGCSSSAAAAAAAAGAAGRKSRVRPSKQAADPSE